VAGLAQNIMTIKNLIRLIPVLAITLTAYASKPALELAGVACETPPPSHCPDANCPGPLVIEEGKAIEPKTGREFFLDYPCNLKKGEKVTFILSLHGFGSYGNWMRHYFPLMDFKEKYRLVIATPNASAPPPKAWAAVDDAYLQNIVDLIYAQIGKQNIKAFWLVGHSQGGMTSNRIIRTDFFKQRVDGWLSLSGGRLGANPGRGNFSNLTARGPAPGAAAGAGRGAGRAGGANPLAAPAGLPDNRFSFIYETGQNEMDAKGLPEMSEWAKTLGCGARVRKPDVVDTKAGYVFDSTRQDPGSDAWGRLPRPGTAEVFEYPHCTSGRIVADVIRESKGHTEGLEPHVTEQLIKLMLSAKTPEKKST
jgi:pimeloyl-ACP methyl ester carboxylesterase